MEILVKIVQLLLSLSILVIFHEFGHFIAARIFKVRVEKFYLFFNPWFSIFKYKRGETEYGLGWLPLGGYVKISGMIDESMDKEQLKKDPQPWEFRSKPTWQRLIIMLGGVTVNVLLAVMIYIVMLMTWGEEYLPTGEANKYGIFCESPAREMGLMNGDKILSVDNQEVHDFLKITPYIVLEQARTIQVIREGNVIEINIPEGFISKLIKQKEPIIWPRIPFEVGDFTKESAGKQAGIEIGDRIIGINDKELPFFREFRDEIQNYKDEEVVLHIVRNNDTNQMVVNIPESGLIGIYPQRLDTYFEFHKKDYNLITSVPAGARKAYLSIGNYLKSLKLLFSQEKAYESVGGFITIGNIFPAEWHWQSFWGLTAFLSIMLAILNVLPIPALDGGHVLFLFYEIITRKKPSDKFLEYAQIIGMIFLFALLIFANGNDIIKLFNK